MGEAASFVSLADILRSQPIALQLPPQAAPPPETPQPQPAPVEARYEPARPGHPPSNPAPPEAMPSAPEFRASSGSDGSRPVVSHLVPCAEDAQALPSALPHEVRPEAPPRAASHEPIGNPAALREARIFRAALADVLEASAAELLRELAVKVLGRELLLAPVDIDVLMRALIAEHVGDGPVRLRVAPADAVCAFDFPIIADPELRPGDAILECRDGEIDARLHVRLERLTAVVRS